MLTAATQEMVRLFARGVRWVDALDTSISGDHPVIQTQLPFSATVTFGAAP